MIHNKRLDEIDKGLNTFYQPIASNFLSTRDYKNIRRWSIGILSSISALFLILFFSIILPQQHYSKIFDGTKLIVRGKELSPRQKEEISDSKIQEINLDQSQQNSELRMTNIQVEQSQEEQKPKAPTITESKNNFYTIKSGDNLDFVIQKIYHTRDPELIKKIIEINHIQNPRNLKVGQRLNLPILP